MRGLGMGIRHWRTHYLNPRWWRQERWRARHRGLPQHEPSTHATFTALVADWRGALPLAEPDAIGELTMVPTSLVRDLYPLTPAAVYGRTVAALTNPRVDPARVNDMLASLLWSTPWLGGGRGAPDELAGIEHIGGQIFLAHALTPLAWRLESAVGDGVNPWRHLGQKIHTLGLMLCTTLPDLYAEDDYRLAYWNRCTPTIHALGDFVREVEALPVDV